MGRKSLFIVSIALAAALFLTALNPVSALAGSGFARVNQEEENEDFFCSADSEDAHPVVAGIAETYEVDYETVLEMFCAGDGEEENGHTGLGEIMLAFQTAEILDDGTTADDLLTRRGEGEGWGEIWQELGLIGRPDDVGPSGDPGPPDDVGPPDSTAIPDDAGKPDDVPPAGTGGP